MILSKLGKNKTGFMHLYRNFHLKTSNIPKNKLGRSHIQQLSHNPATFKRPLQKVPIYTQECPRPKPMNVKPLSMENMAVAASGFSIVLLCWTGHKSSQDQPAENVSYTFTNYSADPPPEMPAPPSSQKNQPPLEQLYLLCKKGGDVETVEKLILVNNLKINERLEYGWTPLMTAAINGNDKIVELLLKLGADPNLCDEFGMKDKKGDQRLYRSHITNITDEQDLEDLALPFIEDMKTRMDMFSFHHLEPTPGSTALHYAAKSNNERSVQLLCDAGADPHAVNEDNKKPIDFLDGDKLKDLLYSYMSKWKRMSLYDLFRKHIVGQDIAKEQIAEAIRRFEAGWSRENSPLVLLFIGQTGIGKTEMAKLVATHLRGSTKNNNFIHIDLANYQSKESAASFIGAPPGYVGYSRSNDQTLAGQLQKNPKAVILFDEADKAHPDVLATLIQLFDEGRLTSGSGATVECPEAVFILTANIAVDEIKRFSKRFYADYCRLSAKDTVCKEYEREELIAKFRKRLLHEQVTACFRREELIGRINELVVFMPFADEHIKWIIEKSLAHVQMIAANTHGVSLSWSPDVVNHFTKHFNEKLGARNVQHTIEREVASRLSEADECRLMSPGDFLQLGIQEYNAATRNGVVKRTKITLYKQSATKSENSNLDLLYENLEDLVGTSRI